jgi:hypothetical protein
LHPVIVFRRWQDWEVRTSWQNMEPLRIMRVEEARVQLSCDHGYSLAIAKLGVKVIRHIGRFLPVEKKGLLRIADNQESCPKSTDESKSSSYWPKTGAARKAAPV